MLVGNHMRGGVGNNSHAVLLVQSDVADLDTTFTDSSRGGSLHTVTGAGGIEHKTTVGSPLPSANGSAIRFQAGRYLSLLHSVDWALGSADFTLECWIHHDATAAAGIFGQTDVPVTDHGIQLGMSASDRVEGLATPTGAAPYTVTCAGRVPVTTWAHLVYQRTGNVLNCYLDGVLGGGAPAFVGAIHDSSLPLYLGTYDGGVQQLLGYLVEMKITTGLARYPASGFTPPNRMD